jgi:SOS-response transcriptional repressor LexA
MSNKMTTGKRIRELRELRGLSQGKLAELCGWDKAGRISNYENESRQPKISDINVIAKALKCEPNWLISGEGINPVLAETEMGKLRHNIIPNGKVPIIEWDEINDWGTRDAEVFLNKKWRFTDSPKNDKKDLFALIIKGESMIGTPKSFNPGSLVVVSPGEHAVNGDYVIVKEQGDNEPILRQLLIEGKKAYLKALNPSFGKIVEKENRTIVGIVIDHRDPRKLV